jgi:Kelch motif
LDIRVSQTISIDSISNRSCSGEFSGIAPSVPPNLVPKYQSYPTFSVQGIETLGSVSNYISSGAGINIPSESLGYYFSGMTAPNGVQIVYAGIPGELPSIMAESLIRIDTSDSQNPTWSNLTLPAYIPGRAGAQLVWLPVSSKGVLLAIGGLTSLIDAALGLNVTTENEGASPNFMTQIPVFDIGSDTWFVQNTSGEHPSQRMGFCSVVANEHGSSGFQIYIYGGFDGTATGVSQGDIWVLSVPSFIWTRVYDGDITHSRDSHTCVSPYPDQMLVIGGQNSANPTGFSCTNSLIDVFNLTSLAWLDEYDPSVWSNYKIPPRVASIIGPSPTANMSPELVAIFQHKYEKSIPTYYPYAAPPASLPTHKATHLATILGSVLGILGLLVLLLAIWCFRSQSSRQSRLTKKQSSLACVQDWVRSSPRADEHVTATKFGVSEVEGGAIHQPQVLPTTGPEGEVRQTMERGSPDTPVEIPTAYNLRDQPLYPEVTSQNIPPRTSSPNVDAIDRVPALDYPGHDRIGNLGSESNSITQLTPSAEPVRLGDQESSRPSLASSSSKRNVHDSGLSSESPLLNRQPTPPSQETTELLEHLQLQVLM